MYIWCHVIYKYFYFFPCLIDLGRTSNTLLDRVGKSRHPCFVPNLMGKAFNLSLASMMLAVGFLQMPFSREEVPFFS